MRGHAGSQPFLTGCKTSEELSVLWFDVDQGGEADYDVVNQGMVATMNIPSVFMLMTIMTNYDHPRRFYVNF